MTGLRDSYLEMMRAHVDEGGQLSHRNGCDLLAEIERLRAHQPGEKPVGWFNPWNDYHGYQQVAKEFEGSPGTIPLYATPPRPDREAPAAALHEAQCYGLGATSDTNQRVILEAAKALAAAREPHRPNREALALPRDLTDEQADAALRATATWLDIKGSQLTKNREKMKARYRSLVEFVEAERAKMGS